LALTRSPSCVSLVVVLVAGDDLDQHMPTLVSPSAAAAAPPPHRRIICHSWLRSAVVCVAGTLALGAALNMLPMDAGTRCTAYKVS
jgi:hypothetical protein